MTISKMTTLRPRFGLPRLNSKQRFGYLLIAPIVLWLAVVLFYPLVYVIMLSFFKSPAAEGSWHFEGLRYFGNVVIKDKLFWIALKNSFQWTFVNVLLQFVIGIAVALYLRRQFLGAAFVRLWVIIPWITPVVVTVLVWRWMLNPTMGVIESLLRQFGLIDDYINLLGNTSTVMNSVIGVHSWRFFPFVVVIILGRLLGIPEELYEAAKVDGANSYQRLLYITLPQLKGVLLTFVMLATVWTFTSFDTIFLMTGGGPVDTTTTLPILVYKRAFKTFQLNEAAALSVIMFAITSIFMMAYMKFGEKE